MVTASATIMRTKKSPHPNNRLFGRRTRAAGKIHRIGVSQPHQARALVDHPRKRAGARKGTVVRRVSAFFTPYKGIHRLP